jgi:hypothetical protein
MPASAHSRLALQEKHNEVLSSLFLNFDIDFRKASDMQRSDVEVIFESKAFSDWKKSREADQKLDLAVIERLDVVIKAIGNLGKALANR